MKMQEMKEHVNSLEYIDGRKGTISEYKLSFNLKKTEISYLNCHNSRLFKHLHICKWILLVKNKLNLRFAL